MPEQPNLLADSPSEGDRRQPRRRSDLIAAELRDLLEERDVLERAASSTAAVFDASRTLVALDSDSGLHVATEWRSPGLAAVAGSGSNTPTRLLEVVRSVMTGGVAFRVDDLDEWDDLDEATKRFVDAFGARSALIASVVSSRSSLGALIIVDHRARTWSEDELRLAEIAGEELGTALERAHLFRAQRDLVDELRELDRTRTEFFSTISHELRTPLTSIAGYVEMLEDGDAGPLSPPQLTMLAVVARNVERLQVLIEDLLTLTRIEASGHDPVRVPLDLEALVGAVEAVLDPVMTEKSIGLEKDLAPKGVAPIGDPSQLEHALMNLLANAAKFTPAGGMVTVRSVARSGFFDISVSDTGIGIPAEDLDRIAQRFFRASNAMERAIPGTGLGLAIVRGVAESHGGSLSVSSVLGAGSTFTISLPIPDQLQQ